MARLRPPAGSLHQLPRKKHGIVKPGGFVMRWLHKLYSSAALYLLMVVVLTQAANAQYRAGVQGVVTDPTGAVVPDAEVTVTSKETQISRTGRTSGGGVFSIPGLGPGRYSITVEKEGFTKKVLDDVLVSAEQMQAVDVQLEVGEVSVTVNVSATTVPA